MKTQKATKLIIKVTVKMKEKIIINSVAKTQVLCVPLILNISKEQIYLLKNFKNLSTILKNRTKE